MAYDYLEDGTPFVALELNDRFNAEVLRINDLRPEESMRRGTLGPPHLPSIVGRTGAVTSAGRSFFRQVGFSSPIVLSKPGSGTETDVIGPWMFDSPYNATHCSALIVLFNLSIGEWFYNGDNIGNHPTIDDYEPVEDRAVAEFWIEWQDSKDRWWTIPSSRRTISPGQTMFEITGEGLNRFQQDDKSDKEVTIRTVIDLATLVPSDIRADGVYGLRCKCRTFISRFVANLEWIGFTLNYTKYNVSVLPIYADIVE